MLSQTSYHQTDGHQPGPSGFEEWLKQHLLQLFKQHLLAPAVRFSRLVDVQPIGLQGLPVVQSPGEGEAMCAALNMAGLADACATFDGDVLLFGAHTVFHTLKLQVRGLKRLLWCCITVCSA